MKLNFCTLFNASYLSRGVVMYESLQLHCDDFHLYVYAFDDVCLNYLKSRNFKNLTVVSLKEFETMELLEAKKTRTAGEYCWTCSSSTIDFSIKHFNLDNCTYVDADMLFYSNPRVLIDEMGTNSVLITSHRYTKEYDQSDVSGKYCVQFMTFKNTPEGMAVLDWWRKACIEWCFGRVEDGKFGDQKYVDEFQTRFSGVHELKHLGGGVAPWNVQQYTFSSKDEKIRGKEIVSGKEFDLVFFHFHGLKFYENNIVGLTGELYEIRKEIQSMFYFPYIDLLNASKKIIHVDVKDVDPNGNAGFAPYKPLGFSLLLRFYLSGLKQSLTNIFGKSLKKRILHHYFFYNK